MKQKLYSLFLAAAFSLLTVNAWADDYEIATAQDLADFAATVNGGETDANAVLTADIDMSSLTGWTPIGIDNNFGYKGTFDGQGKTITGFQLTSSTTNNSYGAGFFGHVADGANIKNFTIYGTITSTGQRMSVIGSAQGNVNISGIHSHLNITCTQTRHGGILGAQVGNGTINIDRCSFSGSLTTDNISGNFGGIVGLTLNNANAYINITNCLFDGTIDIGTGDNAGGFVGYTRSCQLKIENCLSVGTITATNPGQFIGQINTTSNQKYSGTNYYLGDNKTQGTGTATEAGTTPVKVTAEQLASGEIAFKLNGDQSEINWYQALKNTVFTAQQYVVTANGTKRDPQNANTILTENDRGSYDFILPDFVVHTNSTDIPVGDVVLEDITIEDDGTFSKTGTFNVPDENIPSSMAAFKSYLQNIPYTLSGKVNGDKLYANINDINVTLPVLGAYAISVEVGTDNFEAKAPTGDAYPAPQGTAVVYANGSFNCDMTPKEGSTVIYSNTDASIIDAHSFADGFCTVCGALDENYMAANTEGFFEIANEKQLVWFAAYVNQVDVAANGKLTDDIALTKAWTTPIGIGSGNTAPGATAYAGTFDGQGFSITGFNAEGIGHIGLFGDAKGATIKDFNISGSLTVTGGYGGGVVAWPINTTIENVYSELVISVPNSGTHHVGGVVGSARGNNTINNCTFAGSMTVAAGSTDNFAGIAAYITGGDKVTNCANNGSITFKDQGCAAGGIVGYLNSTAATIQNCLTTGTILYDGEDTPKYGAAVLGRTKGYATDKVTNNYWLEGSANGAAKKDDGTDPLATGSVTTEQLASGEVAYKLGEAWEQYLGIDNTPIIGNGMPVSYIGEAGYATLYDTTTGYELNGDVKAFVAVLNGTWLNLNEIENIPAGTPVVLKGGYYNKQAADLPARNVANDLKGTDTATAADGTMYVLANGSEGIGFYKAEGTIPAGKAYYQSESGVKAFFFDGDDATGIDEIVNGKSLNGKWYNLAGQRIQKMQRGINIVGGKKILY